jgi:hypothetical protein
MDRVQLAVVAVMVLLACAVVTWRHPGPGATRHTAEAVQTPHRQGAPDPRNDVTSDPVQAVVTAYFAGSAASLYAGSYLDHGTTVVLVTANADRIRNELTSLLAEHAGLVAVRAARFPLADLNRVVDDLTARLSARHDAAAVTSIAVDEQANRVWVGLPHDSAETRRAVLGLLPAADQAMLAFAHATANVLE